MHSPKAQAVEPGRQAALQVGSRLAATRVPDTAAARVGRQGPTGSGASPTPDQAEILIAQNVMLDQICTVDWNRFQRRPLAGLEEFAQGHSRAYPLPTATSPPARASSREIVAG
jgi:hypothetical protein